MKQNLKIILTAFVFVLALGLLAKTAHGSWIDTLNIIRQNPPVAPTAPTKPEPPNPPTPPIKPEPSAPPTPPCGDPGCPTATPRPTETPAPTSTPSEGGTGGFQFGGPPPPSEAGQVLGATILGKTGKVEENIFLVLFTLGTVLAGTGVRKLAAPRR